jgi:hypothetical protein
MWCVIVVNRGLTTREWRWTDRVLNGRSDRKYVLSTYWGVTLAGLETDPLKELFGMCDAFYIPAQFLATTFQLTMRINLIHQEVVNKVIVIKWIDIDSNTWQKPSLFSILVQYIMASAIVVSNQKLRNLTDQSLLTRSWRRYLQLEFGFTQTRTKLSISVSSQQYRYQ